MTFKTEEETREVLRSFGFDEFMVGQVTMRLKRRGLIAHESFGDSIHKVLDVLENECGWSLDEVHAAVEAMQNAGVVFRER